MKLQKLNLKYSKMVYFNDYLYIICFKNVYFGTAFKKMDFLKI